MATEVIRRVSPAVAAARSGFSRDAIYRAVQTGELPAVCISARGAKTQHWRILLSDLEAFMRSRSNVLAGGAA